MARIKRCSNCEKRIASYDDSDDMSPAEEIYASYINGNLDQMVRQIRENGITKTVSGLEGLELSTKEQLDLWKKYLRMMDYK